MQGIKRRITKLLKHHHYWREIGFDELSELYIGMMFRNLSLSMIGIFIPLYLLRLNYPIIAVAIVFGWQHTARIFSDVIAAKVILSVGPKHTILVSYLFLILMFTLFLTLPQVHWPLILLGATWGFSNSLYFLALHVDFSKVKHTEHGGKEMSIAQSVQRIGYVIGPVLGGILATFFGAQFAFLIATLILFLGVAPLLSSKETVAIHRPLDFTHFTIKNMWRTNASFIGISTEDLANTYFWPLFLSIFVLGSYAYAKLGVISTLSFIASILSAKIIGQLTDKHKGRRILSISILGTSTVHLIRPFLRILSSVALLAIIYEIFTVGFNLPYYKGLYDRADRFSDRRVEYFTIAEVVSNMVCAVICWIVVLALGLYNGQLILSLVFIVCAMLTCLVLTENFKALD